MSKKITNDEYLESLVSNKADIEIDKPLENTNTKEIEPNKELDAIRLEIGERDKWRMEKRYFSAFKLIVGCLVFLGIIYASDVALSAFLKHEKSNITDEVIEIIKALLFTLSGYLFARRENGN